MNQFEKAMRGFYSPSGRHTSKKPLQKAQGGMGGFYEAPNLGDLAKSLNMDTIVDPTAVLDYHMRTASEKEENEKKGKRRGGQGSRGGLR